MEALKRYLSSHPGNLKDWIDQFPWAGFDTEITIHGNREATMVIAERVTIQKDAEIKRLLICRSAEIEEGAEILGTLVCDDVRLDKDVECNYLIARRAVFGVDAEVRSALVTDSLEVEDGAEVDELEMLDATLMDLHHQSLIRKQTTLSDEDLKQALALRLQVILESAIAHPGECHRSFGRKQGVTEGS
ncbi:hypothetical protein KKI24_03085 [bacterium]|nr:hypothetical protein [bacterium]